MTATNTTTTIKTKLISTQSKKKKSPHSPFIVVLDSDIDGKNLILKTHPFYSLFFYTDGIDSRDLTNKIKQKSSAFCKSVIGDPSVRLFKDIPFNMASENGKKNVCLLVLVFLTTVILGCLCSSYGSMLVGNEVLDDPSKSVIGIRFLILSIFFMTSVLFLLFVMYEMFALKYLSLRWFDDYQNEKSDKKDGFYSFLLNRRKIFLWLILIVWVGITIYVTVVISKRPDVFRNQMAINITSIIALFLAQLFYYFADNKAIKTFCLFLSVFIVILVVVLLSIK